MPESSQKNALSAVLLIAHGSRRPEANQDLADLAEALHGLRPDFVVERAYLEIAEPSILQAASRCVEQGVTLVLMLPYFLSAGEHVVTDLERFCGELSAQFSSVEFRLCKPLGFHPLLLDILLDRLGEEENRCHALP